MMQEQRRCLGAINPPSISALNAKDDIWPIPIFVWEMLPQHKLSRHAYKGDTFQAVTYAVPPERTSSGKPSDSAAICHLPDLQQ